MNRTPTFSAILSAGLVLAACERVETPPAVKTAANNEAAAAPQESADQGSAAPDASNPPVALAATAAGLQWGPCPPGMPQGCEIAVLHGDPAKPNADIFLRVPGGAPIAPHWHSSAERMMLVTGRLEVQYQGSASTTLEPGTYAYGPAAAAPRRLPVKRAVHPVHRLRRPGRPPFLPGRAVTQLARRTGFFPN